MTKKAKILQNFLTKKCGFSPRDVGRLYAKLRTQHPGRVVVGSRRDQQIVENLQELKGAGLRKKEVQGIFTKLIHALATSPNKLKERWEWYMAEFRFSHEDIKHMALRCPFFLQYNIDTTVLPVTDSFHALGVSLAEFRPVVKHEPRILSCSLDAIQAYKDMGLSKDDIMKVCHNAPELVTMSYVKNFKSKLDWFRDVVGIEGQVVVSRWLVRYPRVLYGANMRKWQERYDSLTFNGFTKADIGKMLKQYPLLLTRGVNDVNDKITIHTVVMMRDLQEIVRHPVYLTRSFEIRISVRLAYMVFKGLGIEKYSLRTLFLPNDKVFSEKYAQGSIAEYWSFMDWWVKLSRGEIFAYFKLDKQDQAALGRSAIAGQTLSSFS